MFNSFADVISVDVKDLEEVDKLAEEDGFCYCHPAWSC